ncbi:MAG: alpha/beta hydrolase [Anaerolineae bacterium]|nr:alpha/beta hydrolase [Anaerolineae bacterium]
MTIPVNLHYTEQGSGTPLVLLHGFPFSSAIWREQLARLSDQYRVITPDLRGHGRSPATDDVYSMELLAADVIALLDTLNIEQAVIMGHSMGGYVTLALARRAPERLIALGLIGSQAAADTDEARKKRFELIEAVTKQGSQAVSEAMMPRLFAPIEQEDETIKEQVNALMLSIKPAVLINTIRGLAARHDSTALLSGFELPVLIIAGDKDAIIPLENSEMLATLPTHCTLATIENGGHMMMLEQPQATTLAIRQFMDEIQAQLDALADAMNNPETPPESDPAVE